MSSVESFDAIVIGTGQAGKPLASALARSGRRTAIVERGRVGGTCVLTGCTPSKTMIASARVAHLARKAGDYGVRAGEVTVDLAAVRGRKRDIVDRWSSGARSSLEEEKGLELVFGEASFTGPHELAVRGNGEQRTLSAREIFVNTGARPSFPSIPGLKESGSLDSTSVMELDQVPEHLLVLGGGFVGLEFAHMFRRFGSRVTVLEKGERILAREDRDVSDALEEILTEDGIEIRTRAEVERVRRTARGGAEVVLGSDPGSGEGVLRGSHLLVAVGRTPNTEALRPEAAGLALYRSGYVSVNDRLETNVPEVYALGDVNGGPPFTHVAYDDFRIVRTNLIEGGSASREDRVLAYTLFTDPQLGRVGITEATAREEGRSIRVAKLPMDKVARAMERGETRGFIKAVVSAADGRILGAAALGAEGGEIASMLQIAMLGELTSSDLERGVFAHPTFSEALNNLFATMNGE